MTIPREEPWPFTDENLSWIGQLWRAGHDSHWISRIVGLAEPQVCGLLARRNESRVRALIDARCASRVTPRPNHPHHRSLP